MLAEWILTLVIFVPLAGAIALLLMRPKGDAAIPRTALVVSLVALALTVVAVAMFFAGTADRPAESGKYALVLNAQWIGGPKIMPNVDLRYHVGVDGVSLWLLVLTALITPLSVWASFSGIRVRVKEYYALMLLLETGMLGVFCARDLLLFYIFFESTLIPLFFLIGIWGGAERRRAATKFFIYTVAGSVLTFTGVLYLAFEAYRQSSAHTFTFDLDTLYALDLAPSVQWWLFFAFAAGFAIKVPLFPLHTWLPLAHTEAPTAGSVLLAGVLLKLGTYGFLRFSLPMLPDAAMTFAPFMATLAVAGIIYGALAAWVQEDVKKLVAYSSVSHLGFCMLGMFSMTMAGLTGSLLYMINHGLSTGALFLIVGMMYERYHTRRFADIGGLARRMPWLAFFLVFFTLSSIGLPGLNGFVSEFLVLLGAFTSTAEHTAGGAKVTGPLGIGFAILAASGILLGAIYMLHMCRCVLFGPLREPAGTPDTRHGLTTDLTRREIGVLVPIAAACLILGVAPRPVIDSMQPALERQIIARVFHLSPDADDDERGLLVDTESASNTPVPSRSTDREPGPRLAVLRGAAASPRASSGALKASSGALERRSGALEASSGALERRSEISGQGDTR